MFFNKKSVHGKLFKLTNKNKTPTESEFYYSIWVEDKFDNNERCLLFSESDLTKIQEVKFCDFKSVMDLGKLYRIGNSESYFVKINGLEKQEKVVRLNKTIWENGIKRAERNPDDIPSKTFLQNLLD